MLPVPAFAAYALILVWSQIFALSKLGTWVWVTVVNVHIARAAVPAAVALALEFVA